ncbi:nuclear transport factor 2 family protein [Microbulbifer sp. SAOS-129_SWC]|uniref:nuclear transport factor 2 family protein n=1 Tax=Microbulbifer sp. SAOS-129_SWC TaxID=3145235 RepID=UPI0032163F70
MNDTMKAISLTVLALLGTFLSLPGLSKEAADIDQLKALAKSYVKAQTTFDQSLLESITTHQFVEISPKGEVDEREEFIDFYAPEKKIPSPTFTITDVKVRQNGDVAFISQVITFSMGPRKLQMTEGLSAIKTEQGWKLASSQTTPRPMDTKKTSG